MMTIGNIDSTFVPASAPSLPGPDDDTSPKQPFFKRQVAKNKARRWKEQVEFRQGLIEKSQHRLSVFGSMASAAVEQGPNTEAKVCTYLSGPSYIFLTICSFQTEPGSHNVQLQARFKANEVIREVIESKYVNLKVESAKSSHSCVPTSVRRLVRVLLDCIATPSAMFAHLTRSHKLFRRRPQSS